METLFYSLSAVAIIATALPIWKAPHRWVRFFDFPRVQVCLFIMLAIASSWWLSDAHGTFYVAVVALLALCLAYQLSWIFPFTPVAKQEVVAEPSPEKDRILRLLIYNVRMDNRDVQPFLAHVEKEKPDLIQANEVDDYWVKSLEPLHQEYKYRIPQPQGNTYGMALYSRLELIGPEVRFQLQDDIPSIHTQVRLRSGEVFNFKGIHPRPPDLENNTEARDAELVVTGIEVKESGQPAVVAGDLNDVAWSHTTRLFKKLSGMLDPRVGRGFFNTYSVFVPGFRYPLDHIFITPHWRLVEMRRLSACGSDHYPVLVALAYHPEGKQAQPVEKPQQEDKEHAEEILERADEAPGMEVKA